MGENARRENRRHSTQASEATIASLSPTVGLVIIYFVTVTLSNHRSPLAYVIQPIHRKRRIGCTPIADANQDPLPISDSSPSPIQNFKLSFSQRFFILASFCRRLCGVSQAHRTVRSFFPSPTQLNRVWLLLVTLCLPFSCQRLSCSSPSVSHFPSFLPRKSFLRHSCRPIPPQLRKADSTSPVLLCNRQFGHYPRIPRDLWNPGASS